MMDELWRAEEKKTLERIAKLTELGKVKWECVEYNPLCFMNEDKVDETSAYLCQMFTLTSEIGGMPYELEIAEYHAPSAKRCDSRSPYGQSCAMCRYDHPPPCRRCFR